MTRLTYPMIAFFGAFVLFGTGGSCGGVDTMIDTTQDDTTDDTAYQGARVRAPDVGWRTFVREVPADEAAE